MDRVEKVARAMCGCEGTSQCAAICLSRFASSNRDGQCPDAVRVWGQKARAAIAAIDADVREECARQALGLVVPADMATTQSAPEAHNTACYMIAAAIRKGGKDE